MYYDTYIKFCLFVQPLFQCWPGYLWFSASPFFFKTMTTNWPPLTGSLWINVLFVWENRNKCTLFSWALEGRAEVVSMVRLLWQHMTSVHVYHQEHKKKSRYYALRVSTALFRPTTTVTIKLMFKNNNY